MNEEEKKELLKSLEEGKKSNFKSSLDENPEAKRELLIGQLRNLKFSYLGRLKRKELEGEELDEALDKYSERREKLLKDISQQGFEYIDGEENDSKYKIYEM